MRTSPQAHRDYPATFDDFTAWFRTDEDCRDYLHWLRWPDGFRCPECNGEGWLLNDGRYECEGCHLRTSVTAGTIFDRTRTPLTVWFHACWLFATSKDGISAMALKRQLELGSYQTAWAMLTRLRTATVNSERRKLSGTVQVDETFYGGHTPGQRGGRQLGAKLMIVIAVERNAPKGFGRCRMEIVENARTPTLRRFLLANVEPGSTIVTDGLNSYPGATRGVFTHQPLVSPGSLAAVNLPAVHRVASLFKRWMLGTHQGSASWDHLEFYIDEFVFRFNRRTSRHRGLVFFRLLEGAVAHSAVRYKDQLVTQRPKKVKPVPPPPETRGRPKSIDRPRERRPWRASS